MVVDCEEDETHHVVLLIVIDCDIDYSINWRRFIALSVHSTVTYIISSR